MADQDEVHTINRHQAQSGRVSYGTPVVLHESSKTRVVLVPFFIPRSHGTDLSIKLITYRKGAPPLDSYAVEEKSISLDEAAARQLLISLGDHLRVAVGARLIWRR